MSIYKRITQLLAVLIIVWSAAANAVQPLEITDVVVDQLVTRPGGKTIGNPILAGELEFSHEGRSGCLSAYVAGESLSAFNEGERVVTGAIAEDSGLYHTFQLKTALVKEDAVGPKLKAVKVILRVRPLYGSRIENATCLGHLQGEIFVKFDPAKSGERLRAHRGCYGRRS